MAAPTITGKVVRSVCTAVQRARSIGTLGVTGRPVGHQTRELCAWTRRATHSRLAGTALGDEEASKRPQAGNDAWEVQCVHGGVMGTGVSRRTTSPMLSACCTAGR